MMSEYEESYEMAMEYVAEAGIEAGYTDISALGYSPLPWDHIPSDKAIDYLNKVSVKVGIDSDEIYETFYDAMMSIGRGIHEVTPSDR